MSETLTRDELRQLFLFEALTEAQLDWLREHGAIRSVPAGTTVIDEGEDATCFYVLLSGTLAMSRLAGGEQVQVNRTDHVGSYFGATQAYLTTERAQKTYGTTVQAITDMRLFQLPADEYGGRAEPVVPDGDAPAGRAVPGHAEQPAPGQRAGAAARARLAVGRADPRAQQPGRGGGPGHRRAARAGRRDAAQAGHAGRRRDRPEDAAGRWCSCRRRRSSGSPGAQARPDRGQRRRGRGRRLAGGARGPRRLGPGPDPGQRPAWTCPGWSTRCRCARRRPARARCAGWRTRSRPRR